MSIQSLLVLLAALYGHGAMAGVAELKPGHPTRYVVKQGDTLWDIASTFLDKPWLWPALWKANPEVKDPHRIYVGDVLRIGWEGGRPRLYARRDRGASDRYVKLSPAVRVSEHDRVVPPIPLDAIWPFLIQPRVVGPEDLAAAPYVVSSQEDHVTTAVGHRIYIRGLPEAPLGTQYTVVRCGEVYRDPPAVRDENTRYAALEPVSLRYSQNCIGAERGVLGYEALHVADAVLERSGDPATAVITRSHQEVLSGDRLLPLTGAVYPEFVPHPPEKPVEGSVISVMEAISQVGPQQIVVLNRGQRAGLKPGHVLAVLQKGLLVRDPLSAKVSASRGDLVELPPERIGSLMVFRSFPAVSYALVMAASHPVHLYDAVTNP